MSEFSGDEAAMDEVRTVRANEAPPIFQFGLRSLFLLLAAAAVLALFWPRGFTAFGHAFLGAWVALTIGFIGCAALAMRQFARTAAIHSTSQTVRHHAAFTMAVLAVIAPTVCLYYFRVVFGGGGSNVAQLAGESGSDLWSIWFDAWPPLFFCSPPSVVVNFLTFFLFFRPRRNAWFFLMRLCGLGSALISTWVVTHLFPDA